MGFKNRIRPNAGYKVFGAHQRGTLIDPADESRNVTFRVESFLAVLSEIAELLGDEQRTDEQFRKAGRVIGEKFGRALMVDTQLDKTPPSFQKRVTRWCARDSEAGFGRFLNHLQIDSAVVAGTIVIEDNWLVHNRGRADPHLCGIVGGYIEGVLSVMVCDRLSVEHRENDCQQYYRSDSRSVFRVSGTLPKARGQRDGGSG